jgi:hypothetical protein
MSGTTTTAIAVLAALAGAAAAIAGITLLGRYTGTPGRRTAGKQAGAMTGRPAVPRKLEAAR